MNLRGAVLKNFVFDWEMCFCLCEIYRFQSLVGLELPIKHTLKNTDPDFQNDTLFDKNAAGLKMLLSYSLVSYAN